MQIKLVVVVVVVLGKRKISLRLQKLKVNSVYHFVRDKSTVWSLKGWIFKILSYCVFGRTVCFLRGGVRLYRPRVPFFGYHTAA